MATLLIFITPCLALMAPLISPAISIFAVLALTTTLILIMTFLFLQTWTTLDHDENKAIAQDAPNILRAAFAALETRNPGATSASFRLVNGVVLHEPPTDFALNGEHGSAKWIGLENVRFGSRDDLGREKGEMVSWSEGFRAWGEWYGSVGARMGSAVVKRLGGFWVSVRRLEGAEMGSQMV
ncbi:MAG: hypothetical protein ALECFALPRED_001815 [Alectoria fallacina]|uniref:Uncharacterized protein n=1 Tax=Alectoria fallacina TaxID=1903189 RepID=A0A8H3FBU8_9LECA|nr:MAG: hypothetical protein ALECFALPRED_001815 [Alectoria fallacina]